MHVRRAIDRRPITTVAVTKPLHYAFEYSGRPLPWPPAVLTVHPEAECGRSALSDRVASARDHLLSSRANDRPSEGKTRREFDGDAVRGVLPRAVLEIIP